MNIERLTTVEKRVYEYVKKNYHPHLNISEIGEKLKLAPQTTKTAIRTLEFAKIIEVTKLGNNKFIKIKNE